MRLSIIDFGAIPDGKSDSRHAIQQAIDTAKQGDVVVIPKGHFRSSSIILTSHTSLHLSDGAFLQGVDDIHLYTSFSKLASKTLDLDETPTWENCEYTGRPAQFFIYAKDVSNITITGKGVIDGNEAIYYGKRLPEFIEGAYYPRIPLIFFEHVKHLVIQDVTIQKSGFWTVHLVGCEHVLIDGIRILNNMIMANNDGIDPDHCKHVEIKNCYIEAADDAIVFKNTEGAKHYGDCAYIDVHDCELITTSAGIKFGTESVSDFKHIHISRVKITTSSRGISFQLRDEGHIEHITFDDIEITSIRHTPGLWWGTGEPIFISALKRHQDLPVGRISHLSFNRMRLVGENGIVIYGEHPAQIEHVLFEDVTLSLRDLSVYPKEGLDLRPTVEPSLIDETAHIIFVRHAQHVTFNRLKYDMIKTYESSIQKKIVITESEDVNII